MSWLIKIRSDKQNISNNFLFISFVLSKVSAVKLNNVMRAVFYNGKSEN